MRVSILFKQKIRMELEWNSKKFTEYRVSLMKLSGVVTWSFLLGNENECLLKIFFTFITKIFPAKNL